MTKYLLSLIVILLHSSRLFGQAYTPFPTKNTIWTEEYTFKYIATNTNLCKITTLEIEKDTAINNVQYHKLIKSINRYDGYQFNLPCTYGTRTYTRETLGFFRNDSINKKVWLRLANSSNDSLWFDFNYSVGDTLRPTYAISTHSPHHSTLVITKIDSILIGNTYRKTYHINDSSCLNFLNPLFGLPYPSQLIEGIGSTNGVLKHGYRCVNIGHYNLTCVRVNQQNIYPDTNTCVLVTDINQYKQYEKAINIYPNPSTGEITIEKTGIQSVQLDILNPNGQLIESIELQTSEEKLNLTPGLYFFRTTSENNYFNFEKIIITQ